MVRCRCTPYRRDSASTSAGTPSLRLGDANWSSSPSMQNVSLERIAPAPQSRPTPRGPRGLMAEWKLSLDSPHTRSNLTPKADDRTILQSNEHDQAWL